MNGVMNDDAQCLEQYVREGSEPAFRKLVERYLALVNSTARRMTNGNTHLAQDVTQQVFTDLARKAGSLPRGTVLGGWLHRHTCYTALKALRTENRRQKRERIAMELNAINENSGHDAHWLELAPVLDEALNSRHPHYRPKPRCFRNRHPKTPRPRAGKIAGAAYPTRCDRGVSDGSWINLGSRRSDPGVARASCKRF